jgi:e3 binding domain
MPEREYEARVPNRDEQPRADPPPDVVLDVPVLNVDEIDLEVEDLEAHVSLRAELADLVKVNVGVDVYLGKVKLGIKGLEAQALLKVRLDRILGTLDRALDAIDRNPQIVSEITPGAGRAVESAGRGERRTAREADPEASGASQPSGDAAGRAAGATERTGDTIGWATDEAEQAVAGLLDGTVDEADRTVRRAEEEPGNVLETPPPESDEGGEVGDEPATDAAGLQVEEEYVDDRGRLVGRSRDESGNVVDQILDEEGNVLRPDASETANDRETDDVGEVDATKAAERKARELGVRLSDVRGTGSGGRVLVRDVEKAARG